MSPELQRNGAPVLSSLLAFRSAIAKRVLQRTSWRRLALTASRAPVVGPAVKRLGEAVLPRDARFWIQVEDGPATGIWLKVTVRVGSSYALGDIEPEVQEALVGLLRPGMVFFDAGANIGYYSLMAARIVGTTGKVVAFEPDSEVRGWLAENVRRNGMDERIAIHPDALWRITEQLSFQRADSSASPDRGTGHVVGKAASRANTVLVQGMSLDSFCFGSGGSNQRPQMVVPDVVKVDVEGAECELLSGAAQLLARGRTIWMVEIHDPPGLQPVLAHFAAARYETVRLEPGTEGNVPRALHVVATPLGKFGPGAELSSSTQFPG